MKKVFVFAVLLSVWAVARAQSTVTSTEIKFNKLLKETGILFRKPQGAVDTTIIKNQNVQFDYAVNFPKYHMEIRYIIVPMAKRVTEYQEAQKKHVRGSSTVEPNSIFDISVLLAANKVGCDLQDTTLDGQKFSAADAKKDFGADAGAVLIFPVKKNLAGIEYKFCTMVALQKDNVANVYIFYLYNSRQDLVENYKAFGTQNIDHSLWFTE